jgi:hypothetical protein
MKHKSPYGLRDNRVIEIYEVESGLKCNCTCSVCGHRLVAKKGNLTKHHFAHHEGSECSKAIETSLHIAAKDFLERTKTIKLPEVIVRPGSANGQAIKLSTEQVMTFDKVFLEKRTNDIIPDIVVEKDGVQLFIEIAVTHFIDEAKREKIRRIGISTIEIDLSNWDYNFKLTELETILLHETNQKKWIYNRKEENFRFKTSEGKIKRPVISRGLANHVDNCPIQARVWKGKSYANVIKDCWYCDYYLGAEHNEHGAIEFIYCNGHQKIKIEQLIRAINEKVAVKDGDSQFARRELK